MARQNASAADIMSRGTSGWATGRASGRASGRATGQTRTRLPIAQIVRAISGNLTGYAARIAVADSSARRAANIVAMAAVESAAMAAATTAAAAAARTAASIPHAAADARLAIGRINGIAIIKSMRAIPSEVTRLLILDLPRINSG